MATNPPAMQVLVTLDKEAAEKDAKAFAKSTAEAMVGVKAALDLAATAARLVADAIAAVIGPAQEAERAQRALTTALKQQTADYAKVSERLGAFNKGLQESVNIDDDALAALQAKLSLLGVLPSELEAATKATIGLAEITGEDLASAGTKVSKVLAGNIDALGKLGIKGTSIADVLGKLDRGFDAAQARAGTFEGRVQALDVAWEALKEEIGTAIITNPEVLGGMEDLRTWVKEITTIAENGRSPLGAFISDTVSGLREIAAFVDRNAPSFDRIRDTFALIGRAPGIGSVLKMSKDAAGWVGDRIEEANSAARIRAEAGTAQTQTPKIAASNNTAAFGLGANEIAFAPGEGGSVKGDKNAIAKAQKEAQERAEWTIARERKTFAEMSALRELENRQNRESLDAQATIVAGDKAMLEWKEHLAEEQLRLEARKDADLTRASDARIAASVLAHEMERDELLRHQRAVDDLQMQGAEIASAGTANMLGGMIEAIAAGKSGLDKIMGQAIGGILTSLGMLLIQMGTAGVLAGTLGTFIPAFAALTGGPLGVGAGLAAIAGGGVLVGLGSALGGASRPGSSAGATGAGAVPSAPRIPQTAAPSGFSASRDAKPNVTTVNVSFAGSIATGTPRQIARSIRDLLREGGTMLPGT